jgi:hypothetical protein
LPFPTVVTDKDLVPEVKGHRLEVSVASHRKLPVAF